MNGPHDFLLRVTRLLEEAGIEYMVTGSIASAFYGEPRATRDIDVVVNCGRRALTRFLELCAEADWYFSEDAAREALAARGMFNIIDPESGLKADLILRKARDFSLEEFDRRTPQPVCSSQEPPVALASPEDIILSKLEWAQQTSSPQQLRDAQQVAHARTRELDLGYLRRWARTLGVTESLESIFRSMDESS